MKRDTVGKLSWDILSNAAVPDYSAEEQMREQLEEWDKNIEEAIESGKKTYTGDFFLVVETKKEPKLQNVLRNYFIPRLTCPTPQYDNTVYKYHRIDDRIEFLWVLPSKATCIMMKEYAVDIPEEQKELLKFVLDDADGTLLRLCKKLNREL